MSLYMELEQFAEGECPAEDIQKSLIKYFDYRRQKDYEHALYTASKTGLSEEYREIARKAYLDEKGIPEGFRW